MKVVQTVHVLLVQEIHVPNMKGQMSFFIKSIIIILSILSFVTIIYFSEASRIATIEEKESSELKMNSLEILQKLVNTKDCLAYEYNSTTQKGNLDIEKIESFAANYSNFEPKPAKAVDFDYSIEIVQFQKNYTLYPGKAWGEYSKIGVEELFDLIDEKKIIFVGDKSGSMSGSVKKCDSSFYPSYPNTKICCERMFLYVLTDMLSDESYLAIIPYSTSCDPEILVNLTRVEGNRSDIKNKVDLLSPGGSTGMAAGLEKAYNHSINKNIVDETVIVLLTDGCENRCGNSVNIAKNYNHTKIPVHTIAFGSYACEGPLKKISEITKGEFFDVPTCEKLVKIQKASQKNLTIPEKIWEFGTFSFSPEAARKEKIELVLPITIRYNETTSREGEIKIIAVRGELETITSLVEDVCLKAEKNLNKEIVLRRDLYFTYPVTYNGTHLQMLESYKKVDCGSIPINFENITQRGEYNVEITYDGSIINVRT